MTIFAARVRRWLGATALACAAALSAAQSPPASEPAATPSPAGEPAATQPPETPAAGRIDIAIVLPLEVAAYARAADAVRAGFMGASDVARDKLKVKVFAHGEDGVLSAFEAAQRAGARVIVGPLVRDDLKVVAAMAIDLPFTIALNQFDEAAGPPPTLYTFPLSIDADARLIARRIRETSAIPASPSQGAQSAPPPLPNVAVVSSETPLMRRFAAAFASEWVDSGGSAPAVFRFDGAAESMIAMRRELQRRPPAAAVLAMDGTSATLAKPYLGIVPAYASALVFERETLATMRDLDGLVVTEIPWIVTPDAPQFASLPKREFPSTALARLYALGLDAYRVAAAFRDGVPERFSLDGATGHVSLGDSRQFSRESRFAVYRDGVLLPLDGAR